MDTECLWNRLTNFILVHFYKKHGRFVGLEKVNLGAHALLGEMHIN